MDILNILISLASGALGGNVAGSSVKEEKGGLGMLGNSLTGLLGGGVGHIILQSLGLLGVGGADHSISTILTNIGASGLAGAVLPFVVSFIKQALNK